MKLRRVVMMLGLVAATVGASACSDSGSGGSRAAIVDKAISEAKKDGIDLDRAYATDAVKAIPDDDVKKILADTSDSLDVDALSTEGQQAVLSLFDCQPLSASGLTATQQALFDQLKSNFESSGLTVDDDCLHDLVADIEQADIIESDATFIADLAQQASGCTG